MKIGLLYPYFYPIEGACSNRGYGFAKYLHMEGIETIVFTNGNFDHLNFRINNSKISVYRIPMGSLKNYFSAPRILAKLFRKLEIDILQASTPYITPSFYAHQANPPHFILDVRDPMLRFPRENLLVYRFFREMEAKCCRYADLVFVVTRTLGKIVQKRYNITKEKIKLVPNGALDIFHPFSSNIREKLNISDRDTLVLYTGFIDTQRKFDKLIPLFKQLSRQRKDIFFLLIGWGNYLKLAKKAADKNLIVFDRLPFSEIPKYVNGADIVLSLSSYYKTANFSYMIPVKTYEYLACKKPLICLTPKNSELYDFVTLNKIGVCVQDPSELIEAINYLSYCKNEANDFAERGFQLIREKYQMRKIVKKSINHYMKLL